MIERGRRGMCGQTPQVAVSPVKSRPMSSIWARSSDGFIRVDEAGWWYELTRFKLNPVYFHAAIRASFLFFPLSRQGVPECGLDCMGETKIVIQIVLYLQGESRPCDDGDQSHQRANSEGGHAADALSNGAT